jgi:hypothetical protein
MVLTRTYQAHTSPIVLNVIGEELEQQDVILPDPARSAVAVRPDGSGPGNWAGGPSAVLAGDEIVLAYRLRHPIGHGRGYAVVIASSRDGVHFRQIAIITKDDMDTESLERPALAVTADGTWRLYVSCATTATKHWRVEVIEAVAPDRFDPRQRAVMLPGNPDRAVKDPVVRWHDGLWHMWACIHPLSDPDHTDRMWTEYATSPDGLTWSWQGPALEPRPGEWDSRGARVTDVRFVADGVVACYDGRASAAENFEERTGLAFGSSPGTLTAMSAGPAAQAPGGLGLRYLCVVPVGAGGSRFYYELTRPDGGHDLCTEFVGGAL